MSWPRLVQSKAEVPAASVGAHEPLAAPDRDLIPGTAKREILNPTSTHRDLARRNSRMFCEH